MISRVPKFEPGPTPETMIVSGYVWDFRQETQCAGNGDKGWTERITRGAFLHALSEDPDVSLLINQGLGGPQIGWPLARTKNGSMRLEIDDVGLKMRAELRLHLEEDRFHLDDHPGQDYARGCYFCDTKRMTRQVLRAKDFSELADAEQLIMLGCAYTVSDEQWLNNYTYRRIDKLSLKTISIDAREAVPA